jgi:hypothetical protein
MGQTLMQHTTGPANQNPGTTYKCLVRHKRSCCEVGSTEQTDATPLVPEHQLLTWTNEVSESTEYVTAVERGMSFPGHS